MSSHHIIREDQEPALLIDESSAITDRDMDELLEWSPTVLVGDGALPELERRGTKVDVWFTADGNAVPPQSHTLVRHAAAYWMETALDYLCQQGQRAVNIVSGNPGVHQLMRCYADRLNMVLLGNGQRIVVAKPGFSKWKAKGETIWLYGDTIATTQGLSPIGPDTYSTQQDGFFSVVFNDTYGLIGEQL